MAPPMPIPEKGDRLGIYTVENTLIAPWVRGYKKHIYSEHAWKYYDVDLAARARSNR